MVTSTSRRGRVIPHRRTRPTLKISLIAIDGDGRSHVAYALVTGKQPLNGTV